MVTSPLADTWNTCSGQHEDRIPDTTQDTCTLSMLKRITPCSESELEDLVNDSGSSSVYDGGSEETSSDMTS